MGELDQNTILKEATDYFTARKVYLSFPVLDTIFPLAFVERAVSPEHLPVTFPFVIGEVPFVEIATWVVQLAIALFESFYIASEVFGLVLGPFALPVPEPISERALVNG